MIYQGQQGLTNKNSLCITQGVPRTSIPTIFGDFFKIPILAFWPPLIPARENILQ